MFGLRRFSLVVLALSLGACNEAPVGPEPLEFASDPRILRGTWAGEDAEGNPLLLYLKASAPTQDGYQITGFFQQGVYPGTDVVGTVGVPVAQRAANVTTQDVPECVVLARAQNRVRDGDWGLCGTTPTGSPPRFDLTLTYRSDTGYSETYTYSMTRQANELADPNLLVRGDLVYARGGSSASPEPFEFTEDSHAIVQLWWSTGPGVADVPAELIASTTIKDISSFPIEYRLEGDAEAIFARRGEYSLNVGVFSGDGGPTGEKFAIGDLTNETYTLVSGPGAEVEVKLASLESCSRPDADGSCIP